MKHMRFYISALAVLASISIAYSARAAQVLLQTSVIQGSGGIFANVLFYSTQDQTITGFPVQWAGAVPTSVIQTDVYDSGGFLVGSGSRTLGINGTTTTLALLSAPLTLNHDDWYSVHFSYTGTGVNFNGNYTDNWYTPRLSCGYINNATATPPYDCSGQTLGPYFGLLLDETATTSGSVLITQPVSLSSTYEFDFFKIQATLATNDQYRILVVSATSSAALALSETNNQIEAADLVGAMGTSTNFVRRTKVMCHSLNECPDPTGTVWYSRAYLLSPSGAVINQSPDISYNVMFTFRNVNTPTTTPTSTDYFFIERVCPSASSFWSVTNFDAAVCHVSNALRGLGNEVFSGSEAALNRFVGTVKRVFPLSIAVHLQNAFNNASSSPSSSVSIPFIGTQYVVFTSSTVDNAAANMGFDWRTFSTNAMYFITGLIVILLSVIVFGWAMRT